MATGNPSLAARCTSCQTVFRVVPDQLRVSGGWVRCGRCAAVFNAAENLVELDEGVVRRSVRLAVPVAPTPEPDIDISSRPQRLSPLAAPEPIGVVATSDGAVASTWADTDIHDDRPDAGGGAGNAAGNAAEPIADPVAGFPPAAAAAPSHNDDVPDEPAPLPGGAAAALSDGAPASLFERALSDERTAAPDPAGAIAPVAGAADATLQAAPSFVRSADRAARWQQPNVRAALGGAALLAVLGLIAQVLIEYRDLAAARWPGFRPLLVAFCEVAGCRVDAARSIDGLAVESSGLVRIERSDRYRFSLTLRNRAGIDLALPALDLSLTDTQGRLMARRVLPMAELGAAHSTLAAGRELSLQATLRAAPGAAGEAVAGYTIELFYP